MKKYLFLFTITPVQSFIAQARKTQDLYAGSKLLSDLMKFAHKFISANDKNAEIIFPQITNNEVSATHRILAIIENTDICRNIEIKIKEEFIKIAKKIKIINENFTICEPQLNDFLQIFWVAKKMENDNYNYKEIERLLGAVKNVRAFNQFVETGRKCSLCGERNVKFYRKNDKEKDSDKNSIIDKKLFDPNVLIVENDKENVLTFKELDAGEGICAVCAVKRLQNENFPSTAEISQFDIKHFIENLPSFKLYTSLLKNKFDYQLLYKENLTLRYFEKHKILDFSTNQKTINEITNSIFDELKKNNKKQKKYHALLKFDGDSMGKLMSGDLFINENEDLKKYQIEVSKLLSNFALEAKNYLDNSNYGKTIYAGGDDFLAFINLNYLFEVLKYLRQKFNNDINLKIRDKISKDFTFSAGITIAHYKIPLHVVLDWTDKSEKQAKNIDGKDAFTITVLKHSGEILQSTLKWNNGDNAQILGDIIRKIESEEFSSNFIQVFNNEFSILCDEKDGKTVLNDDLLKIELIRLLKRSAKKEWSKGKKKIESEELAEKIFTLYNKDEKKLKDLISILEICDFVVRKTK